MVSLVELSEVTEEGVLLHSPYDGKEILLTPEQSISIQNSLGTSSAPHHLLYRQSNTQDLNTDHKYPVQGKPCPRNRFWHKLHCRG